MSLNTELIEVPVNLLDQVSSTWGGRWRVHSRSPQLPCMLPRDAACEQHGIDSDVPEKSWGTEREDSLAWPKDLHTVLATAPHAPR